MPVVYTARTDLPQRIDKDFYPTESTLVWAAIARYGRRDAVSILDIGAGDGRWGIEATNHAAQPLCLIGVDIRPLPQPTPYTFWLCLDYKLPINLALMPVREFDLIVSNPPFSCAEAIIWNAWSQLAPGGRMVFLLPLDFMCGAARYKRLWRDLPPVEVAPIARRVDFYGRSNPNLHAIYVWDKGGDGECLGMAGQWMTRPILHQREAALGNPGAFEIKSV